MTKELRNRNEDLAALALFCFYGRFPHVTSHPVVSKLFCSAHLAVEEAETDFGAVNHPSVILHVDAALLPATGRVIGERRIPFDLA